MQGDYSYILWPLATWPFGQNSWTSCFTVYIILFFFCGACIFALRFNNIQNEATTLAGKSVSVFCVVWDIKIWWISCHFLFTTYVKEIFLTCPYVSCAQISANTKARKRVMSERLRAAIAHDINTVTVKHQFMLHLPSMDSHRNHYIGPVLATMCFLLCIHIPKHASVIYHVIMFSKT